jgi:hypothetical protein
MSPGATAVPQKFPQTPPSLTEVLLLHKDNIFASMNCVKIGQIEAFDPADKKAKVRILFKRVLADKSVVSIPALVDVPVVTLQGGGGSIRFPIAKGDQCLVFFADRDIDVWFKTGMENPPATARCHDLSDGIALVGVNALTSSLDDYKTDEVELQFGAAVLGIKGGKFRLKNGTTDLLTLLLAFINVIEALQVTGNLALTAASIAALEAFKVQFQGLLYT